MQSLLSGHTCDEHYYIQLFLHPLGKYPGPVLGKLSKFYFLYFALRGNTHTWLENLHYKYGDIVRYGPNELSFIDPDDAIFIQGSQSTKLPRGPWYDSNPADKGYNTLVMASTRNVEYYKLRRLLLEKEFTTDAVRSYEPRITQLTDRLVTHCEKNESTSIDISGAIDHFAFDAMGMLSFGQDFGMITSGGEKARVWMQTLQDCMRILSMVRPVAWFRGLYRILPIDKKGKVG
jgi:cytochrome P450